MKKFGIILLVLIALAIIISARIPVVQHKTSIITASIYNTVSAVNDPEKWKHWNTEIKNAYETNSSAYSIKNINNSEFQINIPGKKFLLKRNNASLYTVTEIEGNKSNSFELSILPEGEKQIVFHVSYPVHLYSYVIGSHHQSPAEKIIQDLQSFLENPKTAYGFPIEIKNVTDSVVATRRFTTATSNMFTELQASFGQVKSYIQKNHLIATNHPEASYSPRSKDSIYIMTGIPVNRSGPDEPSVSCLRMPLHGRLVTGYYNGRFDKKSELYNAMDKYIIDHNFQKVALPYEKYVDDKLPLTDTSIVHMEVYYPIF